MDTWPYQYNDNIADSNELIPWSYTEWDNPPPRKKKDKLTRLPATYLYNTRPSIVARVAYIRLVVSNMNHIRKTQPNLYPGLLDVMWERDRQREDKMVRDLEALVPGNTIGIYNDWPPAPIPSVMLYVVRCIVHLTGATDVNTVINPPVSYAHSGAETFIFVHTTTNTNANITAAANVEFVRLQDDVNISSNALKNYRDWVQRELRQLEYGAVGDRRHTFVLGVDQTLKIDMVDYSIIWQHIHKQYNRATGEDLIALDLDSAQKAGFYVTGTFFITTANSLLALNKAVIDSLSVKGAPVIAVVILEHKDKLGWSDYSPFEKFYPKSGLSHIVFAVQQGLSRYYVEDKDTLDKQWEDAITQIDSKWPNRAWLGPPPKSLMYMSPGARDTLEKRTIAGGDLFDAATNAETALNTHMAGAYKTAKDAVDKKKSEIKLEEGKKGGLESAAATAKSTAEADPKDATKQQASADAAQAVTDLDTKIKGLENGLKSLEKAFKNEDDRRLALEGLKNTADTELADAIKAVDAWDNLHNPKGVAAAWTSLTSGRRRKTTRARIRSHSRQSRSSRSRSARRIRRA